MASPEPNGWSSYKSAPDGPNKLDECGCGLIYQTMLRCQKLKGVNSGVRECVCIPNPDGWYGWMDGCRACLSPGSYDSQDFFDNLSRTITQLFVSCTEVGGGITSDGESICASNAYFEACAALKTDGKTSWASYDAFSSNGAFASGEGGNGTYVLNISEDQESASATPSSSGTAITRPKSETSETTTASTTTTTETTPSGTEGSTTATEASVTSASGTTVATTSGSATATTTPSSAMGHTGSRSQAEHLMGLLLLAAVGVALI
ncbi:uncharacterized protein P884DRAFT_273687 [Thermothelomyces heterothallicus CBS 202.75]|uniref:uncharacterized protein n=1 Tax=Thermothelomyces heterothallicus CBS 202.75 TaxID=1149848 RepID=UPI0037433EEB